MSILNIAGAKAQSITAIVSVIVIVVSSIAAAVRVSIQLDQAATELRETRHTLEEQQRAITELRERVAALRALYNQQASLYYGWSDVPATSAE